MNVSERFAQHLITVRGNFALFWGGPFSNWYKARFVIDGISYNCVEQYMMAQKAIMFKDAYCLDGIMSTSDPKDQKAIGRLVKGFDDAVWRQHKYPIVTDACFAKFDQNFGIQQILIDSDPLIIVEASPYDNQWGIALGQQDRYADNPGMWKGENLLGYALMDARARLIYANEDD